MAAYFNNPCPTRLGLVILAVLISQTHLGQVAAFVNNQKNAPAINNGYLLDIQAAGILSVNVDLPTLLPVATSTTTSQPVLSVTTIDNTQPVPTVDQPLPVTSTGDQATIITDVNTIILPPVILGSDQGATINKNDDGPFPNQNFPTAPPPVGLPPQSRIASATDNIAISTAGSAQTTTNVDTNSPNGTSPNNTTTTTTTNNNTTTTRSNVTIILIVTSVIVAIIILISIILLIIYRRRKYALYKNLDLENARNRALRSNTTTTTTKPNMSETNNIASPSQYTTSSRFDLGNLTKIEPVAATTGKETSSGDDSIERLESFNKLINHGNAVMEFGRSDSVVSVNGVKVWRPMLKRNGGGIV
ncbi:hypothetical protein HDU76_008262 [Blyttiomyces sp. JEL0837]|nr:hypothetical protein HDU76_008262 [Blyttiomyces sp. JEL0837]